MIVGGKHFDGAINKYPLDIGKSTNEIGKKKEKKRKRHS